MSRAFAASRSILRRLSQAAPHQHQHQHQHQHPYPQACQNLLFSTRRHAYASPSTTTPTTADVCARPASVTRSPRPTSSPHALYVPTVRHQQRRYKSKTVEEARSRYRTGPFSWKAGVLFALVGCGLVWYFEAEKKRMQRRRIAEATKGVGRPKVGGDFKLVDHEGRPFSSEDLKGRYSLVYFGFTHCPDICPDELDKMAQMFDLVEAQVPGAVAPVFITCDPARDDPKVLKSYLAEFHPKFIGLTGTYDEIKSVCKAYRVYFSTPKDVKPGQDYLVDHSIYFYLMDPEGDFVEALGRQHSPQQAASVILDHVKDWKK
ncbi:SCO1/SenC-domain-containing protein [Xylaria cf. heliscus]|nr:SCO1/SenC-domain-containing protein [Xylaria cf. heliscus]